MITDNDALLLISLSRLIAGSLAVLVQAALDLSAASTRMAGHPAIKPLSEI